MKGRYIAAIPFVAGFIALVIWSFGGFDVKSPEEATDRKTSPAEELMLPGQRWLNAERERERVQRELENQERARRDLVRWRNATYTDEWGEPERGAHSQPALAHRDIGMPYGLISATLNVCDGVWLRFDTNTNIPGDYRGITLRGRVDGRNIRVRASAGAIGTDLSLNSSILPHIMAGNELTLLIPWFQAGELRFTFDLTESIEALEQGSCGALPRLRREQQRDAQARRAADAREERRRRRRQLEAQARETCTQQLNINHPDWYACWLDTRNTLWETAGVAGERR